MSDCKSCSKPESHQGHLCVLVSEGKLDAVRQLVNAPAYLCFNCGRVADEARNLCNPMPLKAES